MVDDAVTDTPPPAVELVQAAKVVEVRVAMLPATNTPPPPTLAEHPRKALRNTWRVEDETSNAAVATTAMAPPEPPVPRTDDEPNDEAYLGTYAGEGARGR